MVVGGDGGSSREGRERVVGWGLENLVGGGAIREK